MDTRSDLSGYLPQFALDSHSVLPACLLFADISGYTRLSERLGVLGRAGAEIVTDVVNNCFTSLIDVVLSHGGDVIRFGGDALFVAFTGPDQADRVHRAAAAAALMHRRLGEIPAIDVPGGRVKLRMSVGMEDGELVAFDWHAPLPTGHANAWGERVPIGPTLTRTLRLETAAASGQVRIGPQAIDALEQRLVSDGLLRLGVASRTRVRPVPVTSRDVTGDERIAPALRELLHAGAPNEHRATAVGFVKLSGTDAAAEGDAETASRLQRLLDAVDLTSRRYHVVPIGTDVDTDGLKVILACGVPTSTEDDEERLVRALIDIVAAEPAARAGATAGLAFVGDVGHPDRRTFTAMGDTVNLAARLMAAAPAGSVLVSDQLLDAVPGLFDLEWQAPFRVKGKASLQHAAVVRGMATERAGRGPRPKIRGRRLELAALADTLVSTSVVEVVGPAGIGCSRLVEEAVAPIRLGGRRIVWVYATVADRGDLLSVVSRVPWFERPESGTGGSASVTTAADVLIDRWPDDTALIIDGGQHVDDASMSAFRAVTFALSTTDSSENARLIFVGRARSLGAGHRCIEVPPLDSGDIAEMIVEVAPRALSDADLESLATRANGNPRFAVRLAQLASIDGDLPPSIEALVATEIDRIPPAARTILREAATAGVESTISDLVEQCERTEHEVRSALEAGRGLVTIDVSDVVRIVDDTVRGVLAGGLPVRRRQHLHRRRLAMLEPRDDVALARLAYHAIESGDHEAIARWCEEAAVVAMGAGESAAAARVARHGLAAAQRSIGDSNPQVRARIVRIAMLLADACRSAGLPHGEHHALVTASRFETDRRRSIDIAIRRAGVARQQFRLSSARSLLARCARATEIDAETMRSVDLERARLAWYEGRSAEAMRSLGDLAQRSLDAGDHKVRAYALALLEQLLASSGSERARPVGLEAAEAAEASGDETLIGMVYGNLAISADNRGEWGIALGWYQRGADVARRAGDVATMARLTDNRASIQVELGDVDGLVGSLSKTGRVEAAAGLDDAAAINRCLAARVDLRRGGLTAEAVESLVGAARDAVDLLRNLPDEEVADFQRSALVEILLLAGDARQAARLAEAVRPAVDRYEANHLLPVTVRRLEAMALATIGDDRQALARIDEAIELADRSPMRVEQCLTRIVRWQIAGPPTEAERQRIDALQVEIGLVSAIRVVRPRPRLSG